MKSVSGAYYPALDHLRALAALLVFTWHFTHGGTGSPLPFEGVPIWGPLVLFDEGHVGVSLFMTLSGYLFMRLLEGRRIHFGWFLWNRALRLFPLLLLATMLFAIQRAIDEDDIRRAYWVWTAFPMGFIKPSWPNGGWSITVELHFYVLLPILLALMRRSRLAVLALLVPSMLFRALWYERHGEVEFLAYWTIVGRIDQFVLGMLGACVRDQVTRRPWAVAAVWILFLSFYYAFDAAGGNHDLRRSSVWIVLPAIEGLAFAALIAWYDGAGIAANGALSRWWGKMGEYSYSIYLLHFFWVFHLSQWLHRHFIDLSNAYVAFVAAFVAFAASKPVGYLSMRFIEAPVLRLRRPYSLPTRPETLSPTTESGTGRGSVAGD